MTNGPIKKSTSHKILNSAKKKRKKSDGWELGGVKRSVWAAALSATRESADIAASKPQKIKPPSIKKQ